MELTIVDNPALGRYEAHAGASVPGFAAYQLKGSVIVFTHTEVDPAFEGQGIGGRIARGALDDVRRRGLRVIARCPFIKAWIDQHPDYADLLTA